METKAIFATVIYLSLFLFFISVQVGTAGAMPAVISVEPSYQKAPQGETFTINISIDPGTNEVSAAQYELYFNTSVLNAISQTKGKFLSQDGVSTTVLLNSINNTVGKITYGEFRTGVDYGVTNPGTLASITFIVTADSGISHLNFSDVLLSDPFAHEITTTIENGTMEVGIPLPRIISHSISNTTISPNGDGFLDYTVIDVAFSKPVAATISIEDANHNFVTELYSNDSVEDPESIVWNGKYTNGTVVPDGLYYTNVTMDDGVNPLVYDNTMTIIVDATPPSHSNETPTSFIGEIAPLISVDVTDVSDIEENSIKMYVEGFHVLSKKTRIDHGYRVHYQTEQPYSNGEIITVRIIAKDKVGNVLDFAWNFSVDGEPPKHSNESPTGVINNPMPLISVNVTDEHGVDPSSIKLYVKEYLVVSEIEEITDGYRVSYQTEFPFHDQDSITVRIIANDTANNTLDFAWDFTFDLEPPIISILSPTNKTYATDSIDLNYTVSEPVAWVGYSLDGKENITIRGNTTLINLSEGLHELWLYATNAANNTGYSSVCFAIDTIPPQVIDWSPTESIVPVETIIMVTFNEEMNKTSVEEAFSIIPNADGSFSWEGNTMKFIPSYLAYNTEYTVSIKSNAKDSVGNCLDGNGNGIVEGSPSDDFSWQFTTTGLFDTGKGTYPGISGTHRGTINLNHTIIVNKMYTYPCKGTGGHSEYVELYNETFYINATWNGYQGDYHNITFPQQFTLLANHTYNYTIITGSYPQIIHASSKEVTGGTITCDKFIDANGREYNDWIPAIRLSP